MTLSFDSIHNFFHSNRKRFAVILKCTSCIKPFCFRYSIKGIHSYLLNFGSWFGPLARVCLMVFGSPENIPCSILRESWTDDLWWLVDIFPLVRSNFNQVFQLDNARHFYYLEMDMCLQTFVRAYWRLITFTLLFQHN